jgi:hypothetical protein
LNVLASLITKTSDLVRPSEPLTGRPILIWGNKDAKLPMPEGWLLIIPPILMLLSSVVFAFGYYPRHSALNINVVDEIRKVREEVIMSRKRLAGIGLGLFSAALLLTVVLTLMLRSGVV